MNLNDTIVAQSTPQGKGAIGIIRLSGKNSIKIINSIFPSKDLSKEKSHTIHYGNIEFRKEIIDEVLVSIFKEPNSYTKENIVEISCHGSNYIIKRILSVIVELGARVANKEIEVLKERIAREHGFRLVDHRLELYGVPIKSDL